MRWIIILAVMIAGCGVPERCGEEDVILTGQFGNINDKYQITVFDSDEGSYWVYGGDFSWCNGANVTIRAIKSPPLTEGLDPECNVCTRTCDTCQCPNGQPMIYDVQIMEG